MEEKIKAEIEINYVNKESTMSVRQLITELDKYDDNIPCLINGRLEKRFIKNIQLIDGWLELGL